MRAQRIGHRMFKLDVLLAQRGAPRGSYSWLFTVIHGYLRLGDA
jgi:hypothetical protein